MKTFFRIGLLVTLFSISFCAPIVTDNNRVKSRIDESMDKREFKDIITDGLKLVLEGSDLLQEELRDAHSKFNKRLTYFLNDMKERIQETRIRLRNKIKEVIEKEEQTEEGPSGKLNPSLNRLKRTLTYRLKNILDAVNNTGVEAFQKVGDIGLRMMDDYVLKNNRFKD